ncbi:MAG: sdpI [Oscillospiraceae bacterium]|nr:sdpI [Oscillospiraceae bacterium]
MKNKYLLLYILIFFPIVVTSVCLIFMPDSVPMHYSADGEVNRIGSKYEQIIFPLITIGMGLLWVIMAKYQSRKKEHGNEKVLLVSGIATLILFNIMTYYFLCKAFTYIGHSDVSFDMKDGFKLISIGIGTMLCVMGNIMPKVRLNTVIGLRTTWSMKNDRVWQKSQRFGGISFVICGIAVIITGLFFTGIINVIVTISLIIVDALICTIASYKIYKNDLKENLL